MNIASVQWPVFNPYVDATIEIYVSGCYRNCEGCHNPELHDFDIGEMLDTELLIENLLTKNHLFSIISISGGDLLCHPEEEAILLVEALKFAFPEKKLWLFTGENNFNNIPSWAREKFDVIKYGAYIKELSQVGFPSSTNQQIWRKNEN